MVLKLTVIKIQIIRLYIFLTLEKSNFMGLRLVWDLEKAVDDIQIFKIIDALQNFAKKVRENSFLPIFNTKCIFQLKIHESNYLYETWIQIHVLIKSIFHSWKSLKSLKSEGYLYKNQCPVFLKIVPLCLIPRTFLKHVLSG